jgi:heme-degrading monooxygenase HmoA
MEARVAVLLKFRVVGQTLASYERVAGSISEAERISKAPGFIAQAVYQGPEGVEAVEIWESSELYRAWDDAFRPEVDQGLAVENLQIEEEMVDIHKLVLP